MINTLILLAIGILILWKGSDLFIDSSKSIARHFGVTELFIGLTLVSVSTSLPEFSASVYASIYGSSAVAVGNIVGSNIANVALVLGIFVLVRSIAISKDTLKRDGYVMLAVSFLFVGLAVGGVSRFDGLILMTCFVLYMRLLYVQRTDGEREQHVNMLKESIKLLAGIIGVVLGAKLLVDSAISIAVTFGVSQSVIGVTLVAFGTSVPELVVSVRAITKRSEDLAIGNIIGSNIFNVLWVGGAASLIRPLTVDDVLLRFSMPVMIFVALLLLIFMRTNWKLERWEGAVFVSLYAGFIFFNF
jgi:cation:H+ antiporter